MNKLEIALMCNMWNAILQRFQGVSAALQAVELDLCNAVDLVRSLREYVAGLRDQFDNFETAAKNIPHRVRRTLKKEKKKESAVDSSEPECELSGRSRVRTSVFIRVIDRLVSELDRRYQSYNDVCENFGFLNRFHSISPQDLRSAARSLQQKYSSDLEEEFVEEAVHFRELRAGPASGEVLGVWGGQVLAVSGVELAVWWGWQVLALAVPGGQVLAVSGGGRC
ncbi:hypothetical protein F7725_025716 [Dissostichus mawsoni]|uniref:Uncharacterized protein n=1 Tax=Dissostichus mawsoni TaxID=36200 RepID=A0A7J5X513_DISMA|nr:hypothetical protein F7725_025716 [Dissostichus mawsoni]